jgi:CheY-like chemotaxis protein
MPQESLEAPGDVRPVVLVVDDDSGLRESCRLILEDVLDAPDGTRGLEIVRRSHVDVVLLDIRLPGMDGLEVLEQAKALDEQVEVILVTAVKTVKAAVTAMKLGAFDYLTKPFEEEGFSPWSAAPSSGAPSSGRSPFCGRSSLSARAATRSSAARWRCESSSRSSPRWRARAPPCSSPERAARARS